MLGMERDFVQDFRRLLAAQTGALVDVDWIDGEQKVERVRTHRDLATRCDLDYLRPLAAAFAARALPREFRVWVAVEMGLVQVRGPDGAVRYVPFDTTRESMTDQEVGAYYALSPRSVDEYHRIARGNLRRVLDNAAKTAP